MKLLSSLLYGVVIVCAISDRVLSNPYQSKETCGKLQCKEDDLKFNYPIHVNHKYKYSVNVSTLFDEASANSSRLAIEATVQINFLTRCDGMLRITNINLQDNARAPDDDDATVDGDADEMHLNSASGLFSDAIEEFNVRFAFHDGIVSEVCAYEQEKNWALNFKKGILSMLHNSMKRFDYDYETMKEQDVHGECETHYSVVGPKETSLLIDKTKDLSSCEKKSKLHSMIQTTPYNFRVNYRGRNLLKSFSYCKLNIDHKIYNDIDCEEVHIFEPFSNKVQGAKTIIRQKLTLIDEIPEAVGQQDDIEQRTSLLYEHIPTAKPTVDDLKSSRDLIKSLCQVRTDEVQSRFSDLFTQLVHTTRQLSYASLSVLFKRANTICYTGKKHLLDALPYLGSSASILLMKEIMLQPIDEATVKEWMFTIALNPRPDAEIMESAYELLQARNDTATLLGISSLVHTYCRQNKDCRENEYSVNEIVQYMEEQAADIYNRKEFDRNTDYALIRTLKALANIGIFSENFEEDLRLMVEDKKLNVAVRVAAVEAHRRVACEESRSYFEQIYRNKLEDTEVRIAAYLQIMRCPNYLVIRTIQHCLETEEVNQVGSFVYTHLTNLLKSSIPSRVEIQGLLTDKKLTKKFSTDVRKFSHNFEGSVFFEEYNIGGNYESNVIFSPSSYVPRSLMLNTTVDLFGESINMLELYGRIEGFEHYLESLFGPKGPYSAEKLQDKIPKMRWGRSVDDNELLNTQIDKLPYKTDNDFDAPMVSLGMKIFGNDLKYTTFDGESQIRKALKDLNPWENFKRILSGKEININKAAMFLDTSYVVASGAGLPITLNVVGTSAINMQLKGSLKADNFMKTKELDLNGVIKPNVALDIVGTLSADAYYTTTAIKLKTSMHSSSALEGHVKVRGAKLVTVKFGIPKNTTEIFGVKSELILVKGSVYEAQEGLVKQRIAQSVCTPPAVHKTIGFKACADYHFTNISDFKNMPSFVLAGPAGFKVYLEKSDPTAQTYLIEYKWTEKPDLSVISLAFDTPGSSVRRVLNANLTMNKETRNLTVVLQSTEGTMQAHGNYKNTDAEKYLKVGLNINDVKNFETEMSLMNTTIRNGYLYEPKFYLGVNNDRVAELYGTIKLISKMSISQYDVDLKFKTKRLISKLFGYISKTNASVSSALKLDYKFVNTKEHHVLMDFSLSDRSSKNIFIIHGNAKVNTTAYPNYNFNSSLTFQKSGAHIESKFVLNSSPHLMEKLQYDKKMLTMQLYLTYRAFTNGTRFKASASVQRESTDLDVKGQISYDVVGYSTNAMVLGRYAKGKDIILTVYWNHPRQTLENIEGRVNITIPSFTPMILEGKLKEKNSGGYMIELNCIWFSGHKIDVKGLYQDRSTHFAANYHLKLLIRSPSFKEINSDCYYFRNNTELKLDIKADQENDEYGLYLKHSTSKENEIESMGKLRYQKRLYSLNSFISLKEKREILLDLHIDNMRDIYLGMWTDNQQLQKEAGIEFKWDANRDPNQKLVFTVFYANPKAYNHDANFYIIYPGRTIKGMFNFIIDVERFGTYAGIAWSPDDSFSIRLSADYKFDHQIYVIFQSEFLTPFDDWKRTSLNTGFEHKENMYRLNGSAYWQNNQHLLIDLLGDYDTKDSTFRCEFMTNIDSTIEDIPTISASVKHQHNSTAIDTNLNMTYQPRQRIAIASTWKIDEDPHMKNLTGTITLISPFNGFNKGLLVSKIYMTNTKDLRGVANLDVDHRKFAASVEGHFMRLSKSALSFNISTPLERYKFINGRFGFSEEQRHFIALVTYPAGKTGVEIKFLFESLAQFDIRFNLATPLEFLQEVLVIAKLQEEMADFKVGWNLLLGGFSGVWHYRSITDFEYSYKIFTPIDGFEENGITARVIYQDGMKEGLDLELSLKFEETKLGVIILGKPKPKILKEFGIKTQTIYNKLNIETDSIFIEDEPLEDSEEEYESEEEEEDPFAWDGLVEIYTIIYSPITVEIDIDQKGTVYDLIADMKLPMGSAYLRNEFDFVDILNIKNRLNINTPFKNFTQIKSNFHLRVEFEQYLFSFDANYLNQTVWNKAGVLAYYIRRVTKNRSLYNGTFHLHTPFVSIPLVDLKGELKMEEGYYGSRVVVLTNSTDVYFSGEAKLENEAINAFAITHAVTSIVNVPTTTLSFNKALVGTENRINCHGKMLADVVKELKLDMNWRYESLKNFMGHLNLLTPFQGLEENEFGMELYTDDNTALANLNVQLFPVALNVHSSYRGNELQSTIAMSFNGKSHNAYFNGTISEVAEGRRVINGVVYMNDRQMPVTANLELNDDDIPVKLTMDLQGNSKIQFSYLLTHETTGYLVNVKLQQAEKFAHLNARTILNDKSGGDVNIQIETSHPLYKTFTVNAEVNNDAFNKSVRVNALTPFEKLQHIKLGAQYAIADDQKYVSCLFDLGDTGGSVKGNWRWLAMENILVNVGGKYFKPNYLKQASVSGHYKNVAKAFRDIDIEAIVAFDDDWKLAADLALNRTQNPFYVKANVLLPKPNFERHRLEGELDINSDKSQFNYKANYETERSQRKIASTGKLTYENLRNMEADLLLNWNGKSVNKFLKINELDDVTYILSKLKTPKFEPEYALVANLTYLKWTDFYNVTGELFYPGNTSILRSQMNFKEFANMNGFVNASTPFKNLNYTAAKFATETSATVYNRFIQLFWPKDTAFLNSTCITTLLNGSAVDKETNGLLLVELPLATRHIGEVVYYYTQKDLLTTGYSTITYNKDKILQGKYNCLSEVHAGSDKDTIHIELENKMFPVGADYVHVFEYSAPGDGLNLPTNDRKHIKLYHLHNRSSFDVEGDLNIGKRETGQNVTLTAIHLNRTVKFITDYDIFDQNFKQFSKIILGPGHWLSYNIDILNKTIDDLSEAQQLTLTVAYPERNFTALGAYNLSINSLESDLSLDWNSEDDRMKHIQGGINWNQDDDHPTKHSIELELSHPSLEKNVSILGSFDSHDRTLAAVNLTVDYSPNEDQTLNIRGALENHSNSSILNYTYTLWASHPATNLQLDVHGGVNYRSKWFYSYHLVDYKRSYLPLQNGEATTRIDLDQNEIEFKRKTLHELIYFWGKYAGEYPLYTANLTAIQGKEINATGKFYMNFDDKLLNFDFNKTEDGTESLHMYGYIPDARSAHFDIWREYEEIKISDVAYLLKMNHSRLVVSTLRWRPELRRDVKEAIKAASVGFYNYTLDRADYWRQYIRSETVSAISDIWSDAKLLMDDVIEDLKDLKVIEDDLEKLKVYLNNSYNANEFYIKDITNFVLKTIDELSLKSHIESLPAIFTEIWEVMGESGKKIQKGITWVIEKIKLYYKNAAEFINALFQGDSLEHLSDALKKLIEKYDNFIKNLHVMFIRYMEELWKQTYKMLQENWHKTLAAIEPSFIKFAHYTETIMWNASKEVLDFLYLKNNEIMDNPYFNRISNFTHDVDKFYKDMTGNDTLGQIVKYTKKAWVFLKEKYFKLVPFGKELQEIVNEIVDEIYELKKLPSVQYVIRKYNQLEQKVIWWCEYFDIENKARELASMIYLKLADMKQTALQAENKYREAKTDFVFEPADGIMHLEQKLPMSWHAFNETPKFEEIPEYKTIHDMQNYFTMSKLTFSNFYYDYKPYTDPTDWLPPFKSQALIVGSQYYVTFDNQVYNFQAGCTYLLASDFLDRNFTIAINYMDNLNALKLLVLINNTMIAIDIFNGEVTVGNKLSSKLPMKIGDAFLYQEADVVTLESESGFQLECNMKYHVCTFEAAGWYFGKTAGLWGTINNEIYDDLTTSNKSILGKNQVSQFGESWALVDQCSAAENKATTNEAADTPKGVITLCQSFFTSNVSPFATCFDRVPNQPFYEMCLNGRSEKDACSAAVAYMKLCSFVNTPLRIPDDCVTCSLFNGTEVPEGKFVSLKQEFIPPSADVVFIVEAKDCNHNLKDKLKVDELLQKIESEFNLVNITNNRYGMVLFGGDGVLNKPRSVIMNGKTFTDHTSILSYFDDIPKGNGSYDIYNAIAFATSLIYRPGVSKTFILIPCTDCKESNMRLDYTIMHQLLLENDIALHILTHDKLQLKKNRLTKNKILFGIDRELAFTKKDTSKLAGDKQLRKAIQMPKVVLGYCLPLALETKGSVFNVKKPEAITVFAKRAAQSAIPSSCKTCECTAYNSGVSFMECFPCTYPSPKGMFDFSEEILMEDDEE